MGSYVTQFEEMLAKFTGAKRAVAVVNGTVALEMALRLAGVEPGDEVIAPSLTFVATANAISHCGAIPHFVDVSPVDLGICPETLENHLESIGSVGAKGHLTNRHTGRRIKAVVPMHCFGHPCDLDRLVAVCNRFGLDLVEDAAESLGSFYKGKHTGRFGKVAAISFNGNKIITTGGGGAIITDDEELASKARHLTTNAKVPHAWEFHHDAIGWNFRMPNINAALGLAQLEVLTQILEAKKVLAERYRDAFSSVDGVLFTEQPPNCQSNFWLNAIRIQNATIETRNEVLSDLNEHKIQARPIWHPLHLQSVYASCPRSELPTTESIHSEIICLPSSPQLVLSKISSL